MKIKELLEKFNTWRRKRYVFKRYIKHFDERLETELLNEKWIIKRIVDGQTSRREELTNKQAEIRELQLLLKYFKSL